MNYLLLLPFLSVVALSTAGAAEETNGHGCTDATLPRLDVPHCSSGTSGVATINRRLVTLKDDFPMSTVELCFTDISLELKFQAQDELSYLVNETYVNNDSIWMWTVMEAFIATGDHDPTEYLEFEVAPNNVIYTARIHNPNKDFTKHSAAFIDDWDSYPITSETTRDVEAQTWTSDVSLPLSMFNVAAPEGTQWRMNFFRTFYASSTDSTAEQEYGAWNPNKLVSFHQSPCFGKVRLDGDDKAASEKCDEPSLSGGKSSKSKSGKTKLVKRTRV